MLQVQKIHDLELPDLAPYRTLRRPLEHREQGIFVAEGEKVVRRLLESEFSVVSVLLPEKWFEAYEPLIRLRSEEIRAFVAEKELLERLTGFSMYQGLLAVGRIPRQPDLETILRRKGRPALLAALDGLSNAENVGGLVRNCAAFGVEALLAGRNCSSPFLRRAVRSSMGAIFRVPVVEGLDLAQALSQLGEAGFDCIAAHPRRDSRPLTEADFTSDCCVVFGSEGCGISTQVLDRCNIAAAIPMASGVDSLNVSSAAAAFLYEANRQRRKARMNQVPAPA
jgi:tRNA G18 (ribose-2'-O)-methylase SpoU